VLLPSLGLLVLAQGLTVDASAGWPALASDEIRVNGDLELGFEGTKWGVAAHGELSYFDVVSGLGSVENIHFGGGIDAWHLTGTEQDRFRFEVRGAFSGGLYDAEDLNTTALFADQSSVVGRGNLLLGGRYQWARLAFGVLGGGGGQIESFNALTVGQNTSSDPGSIIIEDTEKFTIQFEGRAFSRFQLLKETLSLRFKVELRQFEITRDNRLLNLSLGQTPSQTVALQATTHFEVRLRIFLQADAFAFLGFVPAIFFGLDVIEISSDLGIIESTVPVLGVDLVRYLDSE
jgi:hypothetical protein